MKNLLAMTVVVMALSTDVWSSLVPVQTVRIEQAPAVALLPGGSALTLFNVEQAVHTGTAVPEPFQGRDGIRQGEELFARDWAQATQHRSILGPRYDQSSCVACHIEVRVTPSLLPDVTVQTTVQHRILRLFDDARIQRYGQQFNIRSVDSQLPIRKLLVSDEPHPVHTDDVQTGTLDKPKAIALENEQPVNLGDVSIRTAPALFGWGLLSEVDVETLLRLADESDVNQDGISGRVSQLNQTTNPAFNLPGRFGWKAEFSDLKSQIAAALQNDMGISTSGSPHVKCDSGVSSTTVTDSCMGELSDDSLDAMTSYVSFLGVPDRRDRHLPEVIRGELLFDETGCTSCHVPVLKTRESDEPAFSAQIIWPYSDLLLHDMGSELADLSPPGFEESDSAEAMPREWRTTPLWGIGLLAGMEGRGFLHDGRAASLAEAIVWHGGEAADSRRRYLDLKPDDGSALIRFLESL